MDFDYILFLDKSRKFIILCLLYLCIDPQLAYNFT
jgi:hypothetical protein